MQRMPMHRALRSERGPGLVLLEQGEEGGKVARAAV